MEFFLFNFAPLQCWFISLIFKSLVYNFAPPSFVSQKILSKLFIKWPLRPFTASYYFYNLYINQRHGYIPHRSPKTETLERHRWSFEKLKAYSVIYYYSSGDISRFFYLACSTFCSIYSNLIDYLIDCLTIYLIFYLSIQLFTTSHNNLICDNEKYSCLSQRAEGRKTGRFGEYTYNFKQGGLQEGFQD